MMTDLDIQAIAHIFALEFEGEVIDYPPPPESEDREPSYLESECYYYCDPPEPDRENGSLGSLPSDP